MESENQQEVAEQQEVVEQQQVKLIRQQSLNQEQQEPEVKAEEKEPVFNIPSDLQGGEDGWLELPGPEVYANVFISRKGVLYGIQDRYTDNGVDKYLMKFDFANNKWHEVQSAKGIRKIRFDVNDELIILTDDCRLTIRTKTHLKVREQVADFGVSLQGKLHIIDLGDPASRGEELQEWQSTDFAAEYLLHPASQFARVDVREEDLIIGRNNDKLDSYHGCKAYNHIFLTFKSQVNLQPTMESENQEVQQQVEETVPEQKAEAEVEEQQQTEDQTAESTQVQEDFKEAVYDWPADFSPENGVHITPREDFIEVAIAPSGRVIGYQSIWTGSECVKETLQYDFANNKWDAVPAEQHCNNLQKMRWDGQGNLYLLNDSYELIIRTKSHTKIRDSIRDFGVSPSGRLHLIDLKNLADRDEEYDKWFSNDFGTYICYEWLMKLEKIEMNGETPVFIKNNGHTLEHNDLKVVDLSVGYDGTIWTTIPEYDSEGYRNVVKKWDSAKSDWVSAKDFFAGKIAVHSADRLASLSRGVISLHSKAPETEE